jgi:tetratricopeptide (TPR) repeat protein
MHIARIFLVSILAVALWASSPSAQGANQLFQQALSKEQAEGKLEDAIRLYENVVQVAQSDRALTARALLQIGRCYEKLGLEGARKSYERLIQDFGDQRELAAQARGVGRARRVCRTGHAGSPPDPSTS